MRIIKAEDTPPIRERTAIVSNPFCVVPVVGVVVVLVVSDVVVVVMSVIVLPNLHCIPYLHGIFPHSLFVY
jgi:hypothetical protein